MMGNYRKKPVVIEAIQFTGGWENLSEITHWINDCGGNATHFLDHDTIQIETLEGAMSANITDWIIKGVKGEFYPCKNDIFLATYEAVTE